MLGIGSMASHLNLFPTRRKRNDNLIYKQNRAALRGDLLTHYRVEVRKEGLRNKRKKLTENKMLS